MMNTDREVMRLALEALEINLPFKYITNGRGEVSPCYNIHPLREEKTKDAIIALRKALDHVPDTTKMIEPDMGIDRGAWDDVPDATKWVDELRGGEETEQEPVAWKHDCAALLTNDVELWIDRCPHCGKPRTAPPKREWQWLTDEEIMVCGGMDGADTWAFEFAYAIEAKLKEKNT